MPDKKVLLTVSFGTSPAAAGPSASEMVEEALRNAFPEREFFRAWTSGMLRKRLEQSGIKVFSVHEALEHILAAGVTDLLVQPTHLLPGEELQKAALSVGEYADKFESLRMGQPLVNSREDADALALILEEIYADLPEGELLALMGHGSALMTLPVYGMLQSRFFSDGHGNFVVGTVEAEPGIAPVMDRITEGNYKRVHLAPLLLAAGGHVMNDMCGDGPDSWKSRIESLGAETVCHIKGLGEYEQVQALYVRHAREAGTVTGKETT